MLNEKTQGFSNMSDIRVKGEPLPKGTPAKPVLTVIHEMNETLKNFTQGASRNEGYAAYYHLDSEEAAQVLAAR